MFQVNGRTATQNNLYTTKSLDCTSAWQPCQYVLSVVLFELTLKTTVKQNAEKTQSNTYNCDVTQWLKEYTEIENYTEES